MWTVVERNEGLTKRGQNFVEQLAKANKLRTAVHDYLNEPCDYDYYEEVMIPFWDDFFTPKTERSEIIHFKFKYSKIYVYFEFDDVNITQVYTWRSLNDPSDNELINEEIEREDQRADEKRRCMSGGLMTCDKSTSRCVCMDNRNWLETELVEIEKGKPVAPPPVGANSSEWRKLGCFVRLNTKCAHDAFGERRDPFTCVGYNLCNPDVNQCLPPYRDREGFGVKYN